MPFPIKTMAATDTMDRVLGGCDHPGQTGLMMSMHRAIRPCRPPTDTDRVLIVQGMDQVDPVPVIPPDPDMIRLEQDRGILRATGTDREEDRSTLVDTDMVHLDQAQDQGRAIPLDQDMIPLDHGQDQGSIIPPDQDTAPLKHGRVTRQAPVMALLEQDRAIQDSDMIQGMMPTAADPIMMDPTMMADTIGVIVLPRKRIAMVNTREMLQAMGVGMALTPFMAPPMERPTAQPILIMSATMARCPRMNRLVARPLGHRQPLTTMEKWAMDLARITKIDRDPMLQQVCTLPKVRCGKALPMSPYRPYLRRVVHLWAVHR